MNKLNAIGLDSEKSAKLAGKLSELLANYSVFYQNVRGYHWNIKGQKFFELHLKFEELYNNLLVKVDEIAERILTLDETPLHTFSDYSKASQLKEIKNVSDPSRSIKAILDAFETILIKQREILRMSADADDEGTNALMSNYISEQEKLVWMYSAYYNK